MSQSSAKLPWLSYHLGAGHRQNFYIVNKSSYGYFPQRKPIARFYVGVLEVSTLVPDFQSGRQKDVSFGPVGVKQRSETDLFGSYSTDFTVAGISILSYLKSISPKIFSPLLLYASLLSGRRSSCPRLFKSRVRLFRLGTRQNVPVGYYRHMSSLMELWVYSVSLLLKCDFFAFFFQINYRFFVIGLFEPAFFL